MSRFEKSIAQRFSSAAKSYHDAALAQRSIAEKTVEMIPDNVTPSRILDVGCGTGQLTEMLAERFPNAKIDAIDIAPEMIEQAKQRVPHTNINWILANIIDLECEPVYDLIASSSSLHWVDPSEAGLKSLYKLLSDEGILALSILCVGTLHELHMSRMKAVPHKAPAVRMMPPRIWLDRINLASLDVIDCREETENGVFRIRRKRIEKPTRTRRNQRAFGQR